MTCAGIEIESVEFLEILNAFERNRAEWSFTVESMENDALEQITQRHVVIFGKSLQDLQDALFHPYAGLDAFNKKLRFPHVTNVPRYTTSPAVILTVCEPKARVQPCSDLRAIE